MDNDPIDDKIEEAHGNIVREVYVLPKRDDMGCSRRPKPLLPNESSSNRDARP